MSFETHSAPGCAGIGDLVRSYTSFDADVGLATITRATPVRPQQFLQLVLEGEHRLRNVETGRVVHSGDATLIGLCTYRKYNLIVAGRLRLFFIHFQPGALHALSGRDMQALTDGCLSARAVFGDRIDALLDRLRSTPDPARQVAAADAWLAAGTVGALDGVAAIARSIREGGGERIALGPPDGLSARQFQRRFARQVGVTPKLYARICRLAAVIDMHEAEPEMSWTDLAHAGGYADQAHLTREFRAFVRAAPTRFRGLERAA